MQEYRIEELAQVAGTTVRNIRAYRDRGLVPPPRRTGRIALYDDTHLGRLRLIAALLARGYTLANIAELIDAWEQGHDLRRLLGLEAALTGPWSNEWPEITMPVDELMALIGDECTDDTLATVADLGIVEWDEAEPDQVRVANRPLFAIGIELGAAGVPLAASLEHARALREQVEVIAAGFVEVATTHFFDPDGHLPSPERLDELAGVINRLRPLAQEAVTFELAQAMERLIQDEIRARMQQALDDLDTSPAAASDAG